MFSHGDRLLGQFVNLIRVLIFSYICILDLGFKALLFDDMLVNTKAL
jgi:hypothetical protein